MHFGVAADTCKTVLKVRLASLSFQCPQRTDTLSLVFEGHWNPRYSVSCYPFILKKYQLLQYFSIGEQNYCLGGVDF